MAREKAASNLKGRLDDYINLAQSGKTIRLQTRLYRKRFKQASRSNATGGIDMDMDMCLFVADFTPLEAARGMPEKVTKPYMICPVKDNESDEKTTRHVANERLRMDYARLRGADISFEEKYF